MGKGTGQWHPESWCDRVTTHNIHTLCPMSARLKAGTHWLNEEATAKTKTTRLWLIETEVQQYSHGGAHGPRLRGRVATWSTPAPGGQAGMGGAQLPSQLCQLWLAWSLLLHLAGGLLLPFQGRPWKAGKPHPPENPTHCPWKPVESGADAVCIPGGQVGTPGSLVTPGWHTQPKLHSQYSSNTINT